MFLLKLCKEIRCILEKTLTLQRYIATNNNFETIMQPNRDNPIIDTGLEMTLSYSVPSDAIVGILFNILHQDDNNVGLQKLPVSNIPDEIRKMDSNLKDKPTHQISCREGFVQIGESVLCIGGKMPYTSWDAFEKFIKQIVNYLIVNSLVNHVELIKLRYLNFYTYNIFECINLNISMPGINNICSNSTVFRTEFPCTEEIIGVLQITNGVHVKNMSLELDNDGSLIDIQTLAKKVSLDNWLDTVQKLHEQVDSLFIKLTRKE